MKKLICLFIAAVMLLPLASCVSSSPEGTAEPTDAAPTETDSLAYNPETDADNRYLNAPCCITELDNAFIWHDRRQGLFYYNDKETGENGVLCNKPECQHDSNDCGGAPSAEPVVWYYEGKLYWLLYTGFTEKDERYIYSMNPDSTDKELFMTIPEALGAAPHLVRSFLHRGKIFLERAGQAVEDAVPKHKYRLSLCDFDTHDPSKEKTVLEFEAEDPYSTNMLVYCLGNRVYLLSNYNDGEYKLMVWMYDIEKEELSVVAEVPFEGDEFYTRSFMVTPDGDVYVGSICYYEDQSPKVYKVVDNKLEEFIGFEGDEYLGSSTYVCEDTVFVLSQIERRTSKYRIWVKDYEGNTVFKGDLPTGFRGDHGTDWKFVGYQFVYASRDRILFQLQEGKYNGTTQMAGVTYLIEYDITENGLVEKPLIVAEE